ncbi:MAG: type II secretion system F family protein [candidate division SR1 bacterium]|nr:type II secretion system F family protein [candidate division SR1 bacterium]
MVEQELQETYKAGPIDGMIVSTLQSMDKSSFGTKDKILFFKELSYLLGGGVSFMQALELIGDTSTNYAIKEIAKTISNFVHQGKSLSYALNRLPDYFDQGDYSIVKAGEASGNLPQVLTSLAQEYVYTKDIKDKYIGALIYPTILIIIAIVAVFGLFLLVLPNIFSIASSFSGLKLPWITQTLRDITLFFQNQRKLLLGILVGVSLVGGVFFSSDAGKKSRFQILLNIPLVGKMTKYFYLVRRCRYMKLLLNSGLSYVQTFKLLKDILGIPAYQDMISRVLDGLTKGDTIYNSLKDETDLIPADVSVMIKVGEETANLSNSLDNVLHMYESDLNNLISRLAKVIEPIMLIFVGGIIVVIALGIFGLILQIMQGAGM